MLNLEQEAVTLRTGDLPALWMVLCLVKGGEMELGGQTHFQDGRSGQVGSGPPPSNLSRTSQLGAGSLTGRVTQPEHLASFPG